MNGLFYKIDRVLFGFNIILDRYGPKVFFPTTFRSCEYAHLKLPKHEKTNT